MAQTIYQIAVGFMQAKHLFVANQVGLFEALSDGPAALDDLARSLGLPRRTTRIVADAMTALGLLESNEGKYQNSALATRYLGRKPAVDLRPLLQFWNQISYPHWVGLEEAVRGSGEPAGSRPYSPEEQKLFAQGIEAFYAGIADVLAARYDFSRHQHVLDLGGGTGAYLKALLLRYPGLQCTLFETPTVARAAEERLAATPFAEKIGIVKGDFFTDDLPEGYDAFLMANIVDLFRPQRNLELLSRVHERAPQGARLLILDLLWTNAAHTQPAFAALMEGEFLLLARESYIYSTAEVREWLRQTGWEFVHQDEGLPGPNTLIVAEAAS
jgi:ubiquinone/menaquinone biosynthesis C-methylase UbiE